MKRFSLLTLLLFFMLLSPPVQGQAYLNFDGVDDHIDLGDNYGFDLADPFTVEAWVRAGNHNFNTQIISKLDDQTVGWGVQLMRSNHFHGGEVFFYLVNPWAVVAAARWSLFDIRDNQWHHVACSYDGSGIANGMRIFIDGVEHPYTTSQDNLAGSISNTANCLIGAWDNGGNPDDLYVGDIDEVRIWNVVRTPAQLNSFQNRSYEMCTPPNASLVGLYQMNSGTPGGNNTRRPFASDRSWTPIHGALVGFDLVGAASNFLGPQPVIACVILPGFKQGGEIALSESHEVRIWPNPSAGRVNVEVRAREEGPVTFRVFDPLGRMVHQHTEPETGLFDLDLKAQANGTYYLHVEQAGDRTVHKVAVMK